MIQETHLTEIYRTANGCIWQCDRTCRFLIDFAGYRTPFNVPCFFGLKRKIDAIDLEKMLLSSDASGDIEIVNPCGSDRIYVLSPAQVAEFKELMQGARAMIQLYSILRERLYTVTA